MMDSMWPRTMFVLCLLASLSGTPLRQAEAASDFARSIADFGQDGGVETIDGGIGDDQDVSLLKAGSETQRLAATLNPTFADAVLLPLSPVSPLAASLDERRLLPPRFPAAGSLRQFAWLQCFLF
jgi:hypothetical protein